MKKSDLLTEALLRLKEEEFGDVPCENEIDHEFSPQFTAEMGKLIGESGKGTHRVGGSEETGHTSHVRFKYILIAAACFILIAATAIMAIASIIVCRHEYGEKRVASEPTCVSEGKALSTCSKCGEIYEEILPPTGIHMLETVVEKEPGCLVDGLSVTYCKNCSYRTEEVLKAVGKHDYEKLLTKEASCYENGEITLTCKVCGDSYTEPTPTTAHTMLEATCTEPRRCSVCGCTEGAANGHVMLEATCAQPRKCSVCGYTEGEALGHVPGHICTRCGRQEPGFKYEVHYEIPDMSEYFKDYNSGSGTVFKFGNRPSRDEQKDNSIQIFHD